MLQAISVPASTSGMPETVKDDDPHERPAAEILPFTFKNLNEIVYFPITVEDHLSADAQQLIEQSCSDSILYLDIEPLPKKHLSKIWIGLKAAALDAALHAVIMGLPSIELGLIRHAHAPFPIA